MSCLRVSSASATTLACQCATPAEAGRMSQLAWYRATRRNAGRFYSELKGGRQGTHGRIVHDLSGLRPRAHGRDRDHRPDRRLTRAAVSNRFIMKTNAFDYPQFLSTSASPSIARSLRIVAASALLPRSLGLARAAISGRFIPIGSHLPPPHLSFALNSRLMGPRTYSHH